MYKSVPKYTNLYQISKKITDSFQIRENINSIKLKQFFVNSKIKKIMLSEEYILYSWSKQTQTIFTYNTLIRNTISEFMDE